MSSINASVFGCGYNGFSQLSYAQCESVRPSVDAGLDHSISKQDFLRPEFLPGVSGNHAVAQIQACWTTILVLFENGQLKTYGWSLGESGKLGCKENFMPSHRIKDIKCAWDKMILHLCDNQVLVWNNTTEQGSFAKSLQSNLFEQNQKVDKEFKVVSCTEEEYVVVSVSDKLWTVQEIKKVDRISNNKDFKFISRPLKLALKIQTVSCGKEHLLILTIDGRVFSQGNGSRGQLGHGSTDEERQPRLVDALDGIRLTQVDAGGWHCAVISEFGDLYTWGWNESGQVGLSKIVREQITGERLETVEKVQFQMVPALIDFPGENHVTQASCGSRHTAAITNDGALWTWGWGFYGQLGHETRENHSVPTRVKYFVQNNLKVKSVACGAWNTLMTVF